MNLTRRIFSLALMAAVTIAGAPSVFGQEDVASAVAHKAESGLVLDGDLSDWDLSSPIAINEVSQAIRDGEFWKGETDISAVAYLMWDEENLYVAVDEKEATPFEVKGLIGHNMEDNIKLYISTNPQADPGRTAYDTNDFLLYLMMDKQNWYTAFDRNMLERENLGRFTSAGMEENIQVLSGYEPAYVFTDGGYILEIAIPWSNFTSKKIDLYTPAPGDTVKFNLVLTDNDYPFPNTSESVQLAWAGDASIDINPSLWGNVTFE